MAKMVFIYLMNQTLLLCRLVFFFLLVRVCVLWFGCEPKIDCVDQISIGAMTPNET